MYQAFPILGWCMRRWLLVVSAAMLPIVVLRRPGTGQLLSAFVKKPASADAGGESGATIESYFMERVVPKLTAHGLLAGRDWGGLVGAAVQLRNEPASNLIEVDSVRRPTLASHKPQCTRTQGIARPWLSAWHLPEYRALSHVS